ncbi:helicase C-terminal domain-containing protein [Dipodascopsis uninucleata]
MADKTETKYESKVIKIDMRKSNTKDFHHPYKPYDTQIEFMNSVYDAIEERKIGIFESPTGTGKSLSLICAALTWLRDHQSIQVDETKDNQGDDEPEWVKEYHRQQLVEQRARKYRLLQERLKRLREFERREKATVKYNNRSSSTRGLIFTKRNRQQDSAIDLDHEKYLVEDWESDEEGRIEVKSIGRVDVTSNLSPDVQALLAKLGGKSSGADDDEDEDFNNETKIFFASRTHSQLSQFIGQLKLPNFPPSELGHTDAHVRHVPLSSRKQLCIHPRISRLRDLGSMNEACMDLQQSSAAKKCQYMTNDIEIEDRVKSREFRDNVLADIRDIEEICEIGRKTTVCPYYGSRNAVDFSEIITLPYPLLLQNSFRKALSISLKDQIVIIDEAHNLIDTLTSLYSFSISQGDVIRAKNSVQIYLDKFSKRLNGGNKVYINQIITILEVLDSFLTRQNIEAGSELSQNDILQGGAADTVNIFKLEKYLEKSKLARKVETYMAVLDDESTDSKKDRASNYSGQPTLSRIVSFLMALTNPSKEGKIFFEKVNNTKILRYLLLDVSFHFQSVVDEARCVILAGGTMEPVSDYVRYLFPFCSEDRFKFLSCDHVIPKENLGVWTITKGPTEIDLIFNFDRQKDRSLAEELGRTIMNLAFVIPDGIVVFFPSYKYMGFVTDIWKQKAMNARLSIWDQLNTRKDIFEEPRESQKVDSVLSAYSQAISNSSIPQGSHGPRRGAILLGVVGGKMSEGINYSDRLARGILMVGLPFPNAKSADIVAKKNFIESKVFEETCETLNAKQFSDERLPSISEQCRYSGKQFSANRIQDIAKKAAVSASNDYYENLCMRAVNQSIGRGIRHINDYAVIVFLDSRFNNPRIRKKLPKWIRNSICTSTDSGKDINNQQMRCASAQKSISQFFKAKMSPSEKRAQ